MSLKCFAATMMAAFGVASASAASSRFEELANIPFNAGYPSHADVAKLKDELLFQRGVQSYLWAQAALNMYAMKEGSEKQFGKGYNVLPIWKDRLNAKTQVTTPNSDVIYAMGYLDLRQDGPMVIEVPPGLQGILDDFYQRPICSEGEIEGRVWCGDVGLPGPDQGKGGKYLVLAARLQGEVPPGYITLRSRTFGVFVFWRGLLQGPEAACGTRQGDGADQHLPAWQRGRGQADAVSQRVQRTREHAVPAGWLGVRHAVALHRQRVRRPSRHGNARRACGHRHRQGQAVQARRPSHAQRFSTRRLRRRARWATPSLYEPQKIVPNALGTKTGGGLNVFPGNATFTADTFNYVDPRTGFFTFAYSTSPGMAVNMENVGAKYPTALSTRMATS